MGYPDLYTLYCILGVLYRSHLFLVFVAILLISYALTGGDPRVYEHSEGVATEKASHLVGAGLVAFYILGTIAILSMLLTGVKKFIK